VNRALDEFLRLSAEREFNSLNRSEKICGDWKSRVLYIREQ